MRIRAFSSRNYHFGLSQVFPPVVLGGKGCNSRVRIARLGLLRPFPRLQELAWDLN